MERQVRYQRNADFVFRKIVNELVLVPIRHDVADMDSIYTLNEVGAFIWEGLEQPAAYDELLEAIMAAYEADRAAAASDLRQFVDEFLAIGAVREV